MDTFKIVCRGVIGVVIILGLISLMFYVSFQSKDFSGTLIKFIATLTSWPVVICLLGFAFGITFKREIAFFIEKIAVIRFPGGEINTNQSLPPTEPVDNILVDQTLEYTALLADRERAVVFWYHKYLSVFLVPMTQFVLRWIGLSPVAPTKSLYEQVWTPTIQDPSQREVTLMVLFHFKLIQQEGDLLYITDLGREFLSFLDGQARIQKR